MGGTCFVVMHDRKQETERLARIKCRERCPKCVEAGLVDGKKIHVDSSLIVANASKDSVLQGSLELIAALKQAYQAQESKLEDTSLSDYQAVNTSDSFAVSPIDPWRKIARSIDGVNISGL